MTPQAWVTLVVGVLASIGVVGTLLQRQRSEAADRMHRDRFDARAEWWRRFQWAAEQAHEGDDASSELGFAVLEALTESPLVTSSEIGILAATANLRARRSSSDTGRGEQS
ncbi:hypothetical protein nbrc107696_20580 [Gordonia spumicola]|uniref:Uncharacterized protein n=1 Tax=Gordonia spumicola TaxID=589161 RepID=A0A7I9V8P7_9ACTN|nr:hypothetical protein nbrc107696_20580 [Gordonia spumicola]